MNTASRRTLEILAIMMVGDGVVAMSQPKRHALLWLAGPPAWRDMVRPFVRQPALTAGIGALEAVAGLCLARWATART